MVNTLEGSTAIYTCDDGFLLAGTDTRICQSNGNWSNTEPSCEESSLFPFGVSVGDQVVTPALVGQSPPIVKLEFNVTCPFFGVQEDILYVSNQYEFRVHMNLGYILQNLSQTPRCCRNIGIIININCSQA